MSSRWLWLLSPMALWGLTCALPADFEKVDRLPDGQGGSGGTAGGGGAGGGPNTCEPFTLTPPQDCDQDLLDDGDNCCATDRSCLGGDCVDGMCQTVEMDSTPDEFLDVVLMDDGVVYSTGYSSDLFRIDKGGGNPELIHTSNAYITQLATDGSWVYYTQYDTGDVYGYDPDSDEAILLGSNGAHASLFGGITVDDTRVYWVSREYQPDNLSVCDDVAMLTTFPWVWYAPKDGSDTVAQGLMIPSGAAPVDVAVDGEHLYWTDECIDAVFRVPLSDLTASPELVAADQYAPAEIVVDDQYVYWIAGSDVRRCTKPCNTPQTIGSGSQGGTDLAIDDTHVYWTSYAANAVYRAPFNGSRTDTIATAIMPKGIAVDCDSVAINTYPDQPPSLVLLLAK